MFQPVFAASTRVHFWIKAFIPNEHPNVKDYIQKTDKGTWVIPVPLSSSCFATDNRTFNSSPLASARLTTEFIFIIDGRDVSIEKADGRSFIRIGETKKVNCKTDEVLASETASTETVTIGKIKRQKFLSVLNVQAASANPFLGFPDIDFEFVFQYDALRKKIDITGVTGYFPSFEMYYKLNDNPVEKIINWPPYKDSTALSLVDLATGVNTRSFKHTIKIK